MASLYFPSILSEFPKIIKHNNLYYKMHQSINYLTLLLVHT